MYDKEGKAFLDLQMWYSACNFGYANERLNNVLKKQIDTLPNVQVSIFIQLKLN